MTFVKVSVRHVKPKEAQTSCFNSVVNVMFLPAASLSSPEDVGVAAGVVFTCSSVLHLLTLPKVILALSTWNRGISAREEHRWALLCVLRVYSAYKLTGIPRTYFNRKSRRKLEGDEVSQPCKMGAGPGHEVNNGSYLLHQGERVFLTHPQCALEPVWQKSRKYSSNVLR